MNEGDDKYIILLPIILIIGAVLAIAGSFEGLTVFDGIPLFALSIIIIFLIQLIAFVPAYLLRTEKFFDLTGSITYIFVIIFAGFLSSNLDLRSLLLILLIIIWASRLGIFLFRRVVKAGEDVRFKDIKNSWPRFLITWSIQGLWVSFTLAAALAAVTAETKKEVDIFALTGLFLWVIGFVFEIVSDFQKTRFKSAPENKGKFINTGLWSLSRHPNYFGEIVLWIGIAIISFPNLEGWALLTLISPFFVIFLLTKVSGIPLLEKQADEKWGGQEDYEEYKKSTPVLIPKIR